MHATVNDWIKALRSNKYRQGAFFLNHYGNCCPLGVLCELNRGVFSKIETDANGFTCYDNHYRNIPEKLNQHYGFKDDFIHTIITMNDNGKTFKDIAAYIEGQVNVVSDRLD